MHHVKTLLGWWQQLLIPFAAVFTRQGWVRFVQWVTGMILCSEEHTITQILVSLGLTSRWRVLEAFAERGAWDQQAVEKTTLQLIETEHPPRFGPYHPAAVDDTKELRSSPHVWGACTFREHSARSPNRASTVRAHNGVVMGSLAPAEPWLYLPHAFRLYFRKSQLPAGETFTTKTKLAVQLLRQADTVSTAPLLGVFDGAYAYRTVIGPCLEPAGDAGARRIEILTRLRKDARLYQELEPPDPTQKKKRGKPRTWGRPLPAPKHHETWDVPWQQGDAYVYGQQRSFRFKRLPCRWHVTGPHRPVQVFVFEVPGYKKPWFLVTTALDLTGEQAVCVFAARFRQENGFRDQKQRLGMQECRAWTKAPILRTFQVQLIALTLMRLLQDRLDEHGEPGSWWFIPEWNRSKAHASILDVRRLFWKHRGEFAEFLRKLEEVRKNPEDRPEGAGNAGGEGGRGRRIDLDVGVA